MNEQTKAYFRAIEAKAKENRSSVSQGEESAYWNYRRSLENGNGEFECSELPWTTDMSDFVRTLREAGIKNIVVTERSTSLMENLHKLVSQGCTIAELCTAPHKNIWGEAEDVYGIRIDLN